MSPQCSCQIEAAEEIESKSLLSEERCATEEGIEVESRNDSSNQLSSLYLYREESGNRYSVDDSEASSTEREVVIESESINRSSYPSSFFQNDANDGCIIGRSPAESERLDVAKFALVLLVVAGHLVEPYYKSGNFVAHVLLHLIYSFHVPAFVLISGYTSGDLSMTHRRRKLISGLVVPYLILQPMFCELYSRLYYNNDSASDEEDISDSPLVVANGMIVPGWKLYDQNPWSYEYPFAHLWYLVSLLCMRIWRPFALEFRCTLEVHVVLGCLIGYNSSVGRFLSLHRTIVFMPYFIAGSVMKEKKCFFPYAYSIHSKVLVWSAIALLVGMAIFSSERGVPVEIWFQSDTYDAVFGDYAMYAGVFQLSCYVLTTFSMVAFFALVAPPSAVGVRYGKLAPTTTEADEESNGRKCCGSLRVRRPEQAAEHEQETVLARVYLRLVKYGQRSLYAYVVHIAVLILMERVGYYDSLRSIATYHPNDWRITREVFGTLILAGVVTIGLLLRPFFPTCLRSILEPDMDGDISTGQRTVSFVNAHSNMMRNMVGTAIEVWLGRMSEGQLIKLLQINHGAVNEGIC